MTGSLLDRGLSRCDPKRGQREVPGEYSVPNSEGVVFEAACGSFENTEEFHVRLGKGMVESGDSLCGYLAGVARACSISLPCCVPRKQCSRCKTKSWRTLRCAVCWPIFSKQSLQAPFSAPRLKASFLTYVPPLVFRAEVRATSEGRTAQALRDAAEKVQGSVKLAMGSFPLNSHEYPRDRE